MSPSLVAGETVESGALFIKSIDRMMVALAKDSARASATISREYRAYMDLLVLDQYDALEDALSTGGLVPLPADRHFNLQPRVDGLFPIGEKDLGNQATYISARTATIGALIEVASRVTSGPLEITSLVRHSEYQDTLRKTNRNAITSVPMHTMGLAFDIALVNTPLKTVYEIRDVLSAMQAAGDVLVIGERQQLVFHVVPHPSRLGYFNDVYARAIAAGTDLPLLASSSSNAMAPLKPVVTAEVASLRPTDDFADQWWAADDARADLAIEVSPTAAPDAIRDDTRSFAGRLAGRLLAVVGGLFEAARGMFG